MSQIDLLLSEIERKPANAAPGADARPSRHLAVLTCMDARIDVESVLGLGIGEAHVLRNAGGRVTEDVLRSLAVSSHLLGTDTLVVMQHTGCGLEGVSHDQLREVTGTDLDFLVIDDHADSIRRDIETITTAPYLSLLKEIAGLVYDIESGEIRQIERWERAAG